MVKQYEIEKLIKSGFDVELISFELDIPVEEVIQCKENLEAKKESDEKPENGKVINKSNNTGYSKMEELRKKYRQLFFRSNKVEVIKHKPLLQEDIKLIEEIVATVEENLHQMKKLSKKEKRSYAKSILSELSKIEDIQIPIEQAEKINILLNSESLKMLSLNSSDKIDSNISSMRQKMVIKLAKALELKQLEIEDIDELQELSKKMTIEMVSENPLSVGPIKSKILNKISQLKQKKVIDRLKNDIPISIKIVIEELANGNIDMQKANEIIEAEAKNRVESKKTTKFRLTEEQEKQQIVIQIATAIMERADEYHIKEPEKLVLQLQSLYGGKLEPSIRTVTKNLIARKDFETAKSICSKFSSKDRESALAKCIRNLKNEIRYAEISDFVLKGIQMEGTIEEENEYYNLIVRGLNSGNIKPGMISLGTSYDGLRNITLDDIYTDKHEKEKLR